MKLIPVKSCSTCKFCEPIPYEAGGKCQIHLEIDEPDYEGQKLYVDFCRPVVCEDYKEKI